ncbi:IclR family transcriptional regulator [Xanthobacter sediminis]
MSSEPRTPAPKAPSSVDRALSLLEVLAQEESLNLTELAKRLKSSKPTVFRVAAALIERGWVTKDKDLRYSLGPEALSLGVHRDPVPDLKARLMPILIELNEETEETIHLTRLEGRYVVYLSQLLSTKPVVSLARLGGRSPAHCVSPGLALLAALPDDRIDWILNAPFVRYTELSLTTPAAVWEEIALVRQRGYAVNRGAYRTDVGGVGVAVLDAAGNPLVGISVCFPAFRLMRMDIDVLGQRLLRAARDAQALIREPMVVGDKRNVLRSIER